MSGRDSSGDFVDLAAHKARGAAIGVIECLAGLVGALILTELY